MKNAAKAAVAAACLTMSCTSGAVAQTTFDSGSFDAELVNLARILDSCYEEYQTDDAAGRGSLAFRIGPDAQLETIPELLSSEEDADTEQNVFEMAMIAVINCVPFPSDYAGRTFGATFEDRHLVALAEAGASASDEPTEPPGDGSLELSRTDIAEIQSRLQVLGFDPNGIDGVMGSGTRSAISSWQAAQSYPATGTLNQEQLDLLNAQSQGAFDVWRANPNNAAILERAANPPRRRGHGGWYRNSRGQYCRILILGGEWCQTGRPRNY